MGWTLWVKVGEVQISSQGRMTDFSCDMGDTRKHQMSSETALAGPK